MIQSQTIPSTQYAVQLTGPGQLTLNTRKEVFRPGPNQVLARIECVGLCFSDLKLLKQFSSHVRKSQIVSGLDASILSQIPSYVPGDRPTVPGHEATCRIVAVGQQVRYHRLGERCLVQTDYRNLRTASSNAAFGYNFEGALQEYVLMDERVIVDGSSGERYLIPVPEDLSASAIALVEPWACVEDSYVTPERRTIRPGGRMLLVDSEGAAGPGIRSLPFDPAGKPAETVIRSSGNLAGLPDEAFDDIIYFGTDRRTIEILNDKLAAGGILNVVLSGRRIGQPVSLGIGRVHYGMTRWIGTLGQDAADSYGVIPRCGEIRPGDSVCVVGAGGPMGQMHVIRAICSGLAGISVTGADVDDGRLEALKKKALPLAQARGVHLRLVNTQNRPLSEKFSYFALMAPLGVLVADAVRNSAPGCLINVFAGIPASTEQEIDLDLYIANRCFMFGTSGSSISDMKTVLNKLCSGQLDTNVSVDAISGMAGAVDGIAAVEHRTLAGKIIVYPQLHRLPLTPLTDLEKKLPSVAACLEDGKWTHRAEQELLRVAE